VAYGVDRAVAPALVAQRPPNSMSALAILDLRYSRSGARLARAVKLVRGSLAGRATISALTPSSVPHHFLYGDAGHGKRRAINALPGMRDVLWDAWDTSRGCAPSVRPDPAQGLRAGRGLEFIGLNFTAADGGGFLNAGSLAARACAAQKEFHIRAEAGRRSGPNIKTKPYAVPGYSGRRCFGLTRGIHGS
jgi:hypothetical protein